jgi:amidase
MALDTVKIPSLEQLREIAVELGFEFSEADIAAHRESVLPSFEAYNLLDRMPDGCYLKAGIEGTACGKLKGNKVALKDNVCLTGVPMMSASTMEVRA